MQRNDTPDCVPHVAQHGSARYMSPRESRRWSSSPKSSRSALHLFIDSYFVVSTCTAGQKMLGTTYHAGLACPRSRVCVRSRGACHVRCLSELYQRNGRVVVSPGNVVDDLGQRYCWDGEHWRWYFIRDFPQFGARRRSHGFIVDGGGGAGVPSLVDCFATLCQAATLLVLLSWRHGDDSTACGRHDSCK
jgi:hypothetical protein